MAEQFGSFTASELYCPKCRQAQAVRERLLLVLPTGELYEFICRVCGTSLGKRTVTGPAIQPNAGVPPNRTASRRAAGQNRSTPRRLLR